MDKSSIISEDVKINLQGVLSTKPGMKQSCLQKEYLEIVQDKLSISGFQNLYEFLVALEGEVVRIEFSEKYGENLLYAILAESSYKSNHAKKNANRIGSGIKGKSPQEIAEWKKGKVAKQPMFIVSKDIVETIPSVTDWERLRLLTPNNAGYYRLRIFPKAGKLILNTKQLTDYFARYRCSGKISLIYKSAFVPFPEYYLAFKAWIENRCCNINGQAVTVDPAIEKQYKVPKSEQHDVIAINLPTNLSLRTLIETFMTLHKIVKIDPHPKNRSVIVTYSSRQAADEVAATVTVIKGTDNINYPITVSRFVDNPTTPTIEVPDIDICFDSHTDPKPLMQQPVDNNVVADTHQYHHLSCGFPLNYVRTFEMYETTWKNKPPHAADFPNEIYFLVTYPVDSCRFWINIVDEKKAPQQLMRIHEQLAESSQRIQVECELPKIGSRGAALFEEKWYRCVVLSSCTEMNQIKVFFCDFGNTDVIDPFNFRNTYNDVWNIPPQAVPCKLHGFENRYSPHMTKYQQGVKFLYSLFEEKALKATVVKDATYSQPHIIEIENILELGANMQIVDTDEQSNRFEMKMFASGFVKKAGEEESWEEDCDTTEAENETLEEDAEMLCLFDYREEDLVFGKIAEVHTPNLIYLHLGEICDLTKLEASLHKVPLEPAMTVKKGSLLYKKWGNQLRRILVLEEPTDYAQAKVLHVDYGKIEYLPMTALYLLHNDHKRTPFQARPASLAGVDCSKDITEVVTFLKKQKLIKANIVEEKKDGKVSVELFNVQNSSNEYEDSVVRKESINHQLISLGWAEKAEDTFYHADSDTSSMVCADMIPIKDYGKGLLPTPGAGLLPTPKKDVHSSHSSSDIFSPGPVEVSRNWNIASCTIPSFNIDVSTTNVCRASSRINVDGKRDSIEQWLSDTDMSYTEISKDNYEKKTDGGEGRPNSPPYPPPDIITSSTIHGIRIADGLVVDGRTVRLGKEASDLEELTLTKEYTVNPANVKKMREKWATEKARLEEVRRNLSGLLKLDQEELEQEFKKLKKQKLALRLRLKEAEKRHSGLSVQLGKIDEKTNDIYAQI